MLASSETIHVAWLTARSETTPAGYRVSTRFLLSIVSGGNAITEASLHFSCWLGRKIELPVSVNCIAPQSNFLGQYIVASNKFQVDDLPVLLRDVATLKATKVLGLLRALLHRQRGPVSGSVSSFKVSALLKIQMFI